MREHNRKAKYYASKFPNADDETLYHMARNWTIACIQKITYNEVSGISAETGLVRAVSESLCTFSIYRNY